VKFPSRLFAVRQLYIGQFLLAFGFTALAWAAPDYVTNWPKQVPVEKPDPVMGDRPFWEHWVYSETFSKRFKGFPIEKADKELSGGIQAMVFRIYKENIWAKLNWQYPPQYVCEWDIYFDSSIVLATSEKERDGIRKYPDGVNSSYVRLNPVTEEDRIALQSSKPSPFFSKHPPMLFADGPQDGRFTTFGSREYRSNVARGLSMMVMSASGVNCHGIAPKRYDSHYWLSLFGQRPYTAGVRGKAREGSYDPSITGNFNPGARAKEQGYFRVPQAFYSEVLPKVTLVKVLNNCITKKHVFGLPGDKTSVEQREKIILMCQEIEEQGVIYDLYKQRHGLYELGF